MTISVCMGIYNGEKYIEKQLDSIFRQTRKADEVILCDDCSTDGTVETVRRFIERNGLQESWRLYCNRENRGYPGNFYYVMGLCTGDVVFPADQDDVWAETKLERMCAALERHPEAAAVACKFGLMDGEGEKIHAVMAPTHSLETGKLHRVELREIFYKYQWPGMVLAYRNGWYRERREDGTEAYRIPHDIFLCAMAAEEGAFFQLDEELAYHRRHESNTAAEEHRVGRLLEKERKLWEIEKYLDMLRAFQGGEVLRTEEGKRTLQEKLSTMEGRHEALKSGKMWMVLRRAFRDRRNVRLATVVCDLVIVRGEKGNGEKSKTTCRNRKF
ncbi:MAG: glycosyltransferase [Lachnospiraceae bacterium]|nr:glycosyltransferase [Lachnospiraceae bacterium]